METMEIKVNYYDAFYQHPETKEWIWDECFYAKNKDDALKLFDDSLCFLKRDFELKVELSSKADLLIKYDLNNIEVYEGADLICDNSNYNDQVEYFIDYFVEA